MILSHLLDILPNSSLLVLSYLVLVEIYIYIYFEMVEIYIYKMYYDPIHKVQAHVKQSIALVKIQPGTVHL